MTDHIRPRRLICLLAATVMAAGLLSGPGVAVAGAPAGGTSTDVRLYPARTTVAKTAVWTAVVVEVGNIDSVPANPVTVTLAKAKGVQIQDRTLRTGRIPAWGSAVVRFRVRAYKAAATSTTLRFTGVSAGAPQAKRASKLLVVKPGLPPRLGRWSLRRGAPANKTWTFSISQDRRRMVGLTGQALLYCYTPSPEPWRLRLTAPTFKIDARGRVAQTARKSHRLSGGGIVDMYWTVGARFLRNRTTVGHLYVLTVTRSTGTQCELGSPQGFTAKRR